MKIPYLLRVSLPLFATLFLMGGQGFADIIPANRKIAWTPGTLTGVIGGIPARTTIYKNVVTDLGADNTGAADTSQIIIDALYSCPDSQVVYLPAGTYKINSRVLVGLKGKLTLRGAGMGQTILKGTAGVGGNAVLQFGGSDWPRPASTLVVTSGATKGSTVLTMADTSTVTVGKVIRLEQPSPIWAKDLSGAVNPFHIHFKVTSKTSTTITLNHPLPMDFTNGPRVAVYNHGSVSGIGIEDLTVDLLDTTAIAAINWDTIDNSWIRNVEITGSFSRQMFLNTITNCEIRHCYIHDGRGFGPNKEGVDLLEGSCWNLIEDNIIKAAGYPSIILGDWKGGCTGNVIAYNYIKDTIPYADTAGTAISDNHGSYNLFNLIEGNVAQNFTSDGYYSGAGYSTLFRNYFSGNFGSLRAQWAIGLKHYSVFYNIVGNVLGDSTMSPIQKYEIETPAYDDYSLANRLIYQLGYPNAGNTGWQGTVALATPPDYNAESNSISVIPQKYDPNVKATLLRHGNYDYVNSATRWDTSISDKTIPSSLIYSAKPSWWPSTGPWPPIGPDMTPMVSEIPAQTRFRTPLTTAPSPPSNLRQTP